MRQCISTKTRLLITLRYLATGENFSTLSPAFRISIPAISNIITETIPAIYDALQSDYLKTPQSKAEWLAVADKFYKLWNFPNCLGAIDGKHIAFRASKTDGSSFYNYKGFNSIVLMALVDAEYKFIYIDVGCNGRVSDGGVFVQSSLCQGISGNIMDFPDDSGLPNDCTTKKIPYVFIADEAFRLTTRMMKPIGRRSTKEEKIYNYRLSRARRIVENAFGILANRFQLLQREIRLDVQKAQQITLACCALHNFILEHEGLQSSNVDHENTTTVELVNSNWHTKIQMTYLEPTNARPKLDALDVRNEFLRYFNGPGSVPWQSNKAIEKFNF